MSVQLQPLSEITQRATSALIKEIGVVDTIRFLGQFRAGTGNYIEERERLFQDMTVKDLVREMKAQHSPLPASNQGNRPA